MMLGFWFPKNNKLNKWTTEFFLITNEELVDSRTNIWKTEFTIGLGKL